MEFNEDVLKEYNIKIITYADLPFSAPTGGMWIISEKCIIPCSFKNCTHYGTALVLLSSLGFKKFTVRLNYIIKRYGTLERFYNYLGEIPWRRSDSIKNKHMLTYEEVYQAMYDLNAVRFFTNLKTNSRLSIDIITPNIGNKKTIKLARDIAMLYTDEINFYSHIA